MSRGTDGNAWRERLDPWRETLIIELRLAGVRGKRIGEVLAEVESHCAESRESPVEAFGDAEDYAREVVAGLGPEDLAPPDRPHRLVGLAVATLIGVPAFLSAVDAVVHRRQAEFTVGQLISFGCGVIISVAAPGLPWLLRQGKAVFGALLWIALGLTTAPLAVWREPAARLPALPILVIGTILVGTSLLTVVRSTKGGDGSRSRSAPGSRPTGSRSRPYLPVGLDDVSCYPALFAALRRRGYGDDELRQVAGRNLLRAWHDADAVGARLRVERGPSLARIEELDGPRTVRQ